MSFTTEINNIKAEINSGLSASQYTAKDLVYVSKAIEALANAEGSSGIFTEATVNTILYVGANANDFEDTGNLTDPIAVFSKAGGASSFAQLAFRNETSTSSTDIIAYMNNGDDSEGWVGMGIAGSAFDDTTYGITGPGDGYIFTNTKPGTGRKGNLVFATGDAGEDNKLIFAAGGFASGDTQMEITPAATGVPGNVHIEIATASTSPSTGALTIVGGVGIQGDINIAGNVTFGGSGTTLETSTLAVADPLIFVGSGNTTDAVDLGLIAEYGEAVSPTITKTVTNKALTSDVATLTTGAEHGFAVGDIVVVTTVDATFNGTHVITGVPTSTTFTFTKDAANVTSAAVSPVGGAEVSSRRRFAGVVRDASDGVMKAFKQAITKPSSSVNFSEAGLGYNDFRVAALTASSATIGSVTNTEIGYLSGVTSAIQTQINTLSTNKANLASPTFTGTVTLPSDTAIGDVSATEIGYVNGVSSNIQTQLDSKLSSATAASAYAPLLQTTTSPSFSSNNYTLVLSDKDKIVLASNGSTAGTVTIPSGVFAAGSVITVVQTGTGQLTLTASGTTINSQGGKLKLNGQYASCQLICTASNTFLAIGNLVA